MLKISTIIPVYNALEDVKKCLDSLVKNYDFSNELIIIDDCSDTETQKFLQVFVADTANVKLLINKENVGYLKSCNYAINHATGNIIILLNSDTMIPPLFCKKIKKCFEHNPDIGVACPILSNSGHKDYMIPLPWGKDINFMNNLLDRRHVPAYPQTLSCNGSCFCVRKEVFEKIGYFDEIYGKGYYEEVDFCYRAIKAGFLCVIIDNLYIHHKWHASFNSEERKQLLQKNEQIFLAKWEGFAEKWYKKNGCTHYIYKLQKKIFRHQPLLIQNSHERLKIFLFGIKIFSYKKAQNSDA